MQPLEPITRIRKSYQMLPNTYKRFQSVLKPYSATSGTRLCVPSTSEVQIPRTQKEEPH